MINILIVDDEPTIHKITDKLLAPLDIEVHHAFNGDEAIKFLQTVRFDLVFMDIYMPRKTGIETTEIILNQNPKIEIIGMTASSAEELETSAFGVGMRLFFNKPISKEKLFSAISLHHPEIFH
jgi:CheY-like chemotaxis protein